MKPTKSGTSKSPLISVLIATKDRPADIAACLASIIKGSYTKFEILIADQSVNTETKKSVETLNDRRLRYFQQKIIGKSKALNFLLTKAKGEIYVFTDDDCIAHPHWLTSLTAAYISHPEIGGVLGKVLPYQQNRKRNTTCPSIFRGRITSLITNRHLISYKAIGMGNNMSFRRHVVTHTGNFLSWLGPGSAHGFAGGDESEYMYRVLLHRYQLLYEPSVQVWHNRWLPLYPAESLQADYSKGLYAFWMYYIVKTGDFLLMRNIWIRAKERILPRLITAIRHLYRNIPAALHDDMRLLYRDCTAITTGLWVGLIHALM